MERHPNDLTTDEEIDEAIGRWDLFAGFSGVPVGQREARSGSLG
jgi:hypothetical protein